MNELRAEFCPNTGEVCPVRVATLEIANEIQSSRHKTASDVSLAESRQAEIFDTRGDCEGSCLTLRTIIKKALTSFPADLSRMPMDKKGYLAD